MSEPVKPARHISNCPICQYQASAVSAESADVSVIEHVAYRHQSPSLAIEHSWDQ